MKQTTARPPATPSFCSTEGGTGWPTPSGSAAVAHGGYATRSAAAAQGGLAGSTRPRQYKDAAASMRAIVAVCPPRLRY
jgi:hypothetical protein